MAFTGDSLPEKIIVLCANAQSMMNIHVCMVTKPSPFEFSMQINYHALSSIILAKNIAEVTTRSKNIIETE